MDRTYKVEPCYGTWAVFVEITNGQGIFIRKLTGIYQSRLDAEKFAKLGNYIFKKAQETFKELAGVGR